MNQYGKAYIDPITGRVAHVYTQDTPLTFEPILDLPDGILVKEFEVEHSGENHLHADVLLKGMEFRDGDIELSMAVKDARLVQAALWNRSRPRPEKEEGNAAI